MPELAEAEFFRKRWHQAARPSPKILRVHTHDAKKLFRTAPAHALRAALAQQDENCLMEFKSRTEGVVRSGD